MDICVVISDLGAGGSQRVLINLLKQWQSIYRIAVITLSPPSQDFFTLPDMVERHVIGGISHSPNVLTGLIANLKRVNRLRKKIQQLSPRIVLSFIGPTNILTLLATRGIKTRVVISERSDPKVQSFGRMWHMLRWMLYRFADRVTANNQGALQTLSTYVSASKLFLVPNPLTIEEEGKDTFLFEHPTILAVGRLHPVKGHDILLKAFSQFKLKYPQWQLAFVGDGKLKKELQQLAAELNIADSVLWIGQVNNPFVFYRAATLFAMPSRHEGMPNALLEAMVCGLPVIVSDASPGPLEYVKDHVTGLVVNKENVSALTEAMLTLAADPIKCKQLGKNAQEAVKSNSIEEVMKVWGELL